MLLDYLNQSYSNHQITLQFKSITYQ